MKIIFLLLLISACTSRRPVIHIESSSPAQIVRNGKVVCISTPCDVVGYSVSDSLGHCDHGSFNTFLALPLESGRPQYKTLTVPCNHKINLYFEMESLVNETIQHERIFRVPAETY